MIRTIFSKLKRAKNLLKFSLFFLILISSGLLINSALSANPVTTIITAPLEKSNNLPSVVASGDADVGSTIQSARYQIYPSSGSPSGSWYQCTANGGFSFGDNYVEYTCLVASLPDGSYKMNIESVDNNNLTHAVQTSAFIVDRIAPVVSFDDLPNAPNPIKFNDPVFTGTVTDSLTNVTLVQYKWSLASTSDPVPPTFGDAGWTNCDAVTPGLSVSFRCDPGYNFPESFKGDEYRMHVRGVDEVNNVSTYTNYYKFQVDTVNPYNLAITYPDAAGITLYANNYYDITWTPPADAFELLSLPIKIEYSANGTFVSPTILTSSYSGTGPFSWLVPSDDTSSARIRITATDLAGNFITSTSTNPFTIVPYSAPIVDINPITNNATNTLPITITADAYDPETIVSAEYRIDSGSWNSCSATDGSYGGISENLTCGPFGGLTQGSHTITVRAYDSVNDIGSDSYVFIYDNSDPIVDAGYLGTINLPTIPEATEFDAYSSISSRTWSQSSGPGTIIFSNDNILNPNISADTVSATPYVAELTVCDIAGNCASDTVSFTWTDQPLNFNIIEPSGGERLRGGDNFLIEWTNLGGATLDHFDIEYSINGGANWTSIVTDLSSVTVSYSWTIPNENSENVLVRVNALDIGNSLLLDASSNVFAIDSTAPTVDAGYLGTINSATSPGATASDIFDTLGELTYAWVRVSGPSAINFGGGSNILNPSISSTVTGTYVAQLTVTDRVGNSSSDTVSFDWDGNPPDFLVTNPAAAANIRGTSVVPIVWTIPSGAVSYRLEYTTNNGSNFTTIVASTAGIATTSGRYYNWTVPAANSNQSFVRVTASDAYGNTSSSNSGTFTIDSLPPVVEAGVFADAVLAPTQSTGVSASDSGSGIATYAWTKVSGPGIVTFGGGADILSPFISADTSGIYTVRLTVTDNVGHSAYDDVSFLFNTDPTSPWITAPAINAFWKGGVSRDVTWTMQVDPGDLSGFTIDYSINDGSSWSNIGTLVASTSRLINWNVPEVNSTTSLMRLVAVDISGNTSTTTNQFTIDSIAPVINIGSIGTTTVETTSGTTVTDNIDGPNDLTYLWSAVNTPAGGTLNFSATTTVDPIMSGTVSGNYTAQIIAQDRAGHISTGLITFYWQSQPGEPVISTPNETTFSQGGAVQDIDWTLTDIVDLDYFDLSYSLNNGGIWNSIATTTAESRTYAWSVPNGLNSTSSLIKIDAYDNNGGQSTGTSSNFTIDSIFPVITIGDIGTTTVATTSGTTATDNIDNASELTYSWSATSVPTNGTLVFSSSSIIDPLMSGTVSGNYTAEITVTDRAGHSSTDSLTFYWQGEPDVPVITNPNNSVFAKGGSIQNIDWSLPVTEDLDYFILSYSLNDGSTWDLIATTTPTSRLYAWTIPSGLNSTSSLIKIDAYDIYDNYSVGTSSNFTIDSLAPVIDIGSIDNTTVATTSGTVVTDNIDGPDDLTYVWTAENVPSGGTLIFSPSSSVMDPAMGGTVTGFYTARITATDRAGHSSSKILVFYWQAEPGIPIITNPTDITYIAGGSTQRVDWFLSDVVDLDHFNMSYSIDNGSIWNLVTSSIATTSRTYDWAVPNGLNSTSSLVKIDAYDIYNSSSSGISPNFIIDSIAPIINIGDIGTTTVATTSGTIVTDNIDGPDDLTYLWSPISAPAGGTLILSSNAVMDPVMEGTVSGYYTTQLTATDRSGHVATDLLTFYWQGEPDVPLITTPNASTFVKGGVEQVINWTIPAVSDLDYFDISYSINDGSSWILATSSLAATNRSYNWLVPDGLNSTSSLIKIDAYDIYDNYSVGTSSNFTIDSIAPVIDIGSIVTATMATTSGTTVTDNIDEPSDITYSWSAAVVPSGGSLVFTPSSSIMDPAMAGTVTGTYAAQLIATDRAGNSSTRTLTFDWQAEPGIPTVSSPTDATFVKAGTIQSINWFINAVDLDYFDLSYSINNGLTWDSIATTTAASRTYAWTIPDAINSTSSLIKVDAYDIHGVKSTGISANFTIDSIVPVITVGNLGRIRVETNSGTTATDNIDGPDDLTYLWSSVITPGGGTLVLSSASEIDPTFSGTVSGSYTANLYVSDRSGNVSTSPLTFYWEGEPDVPTLTSPTSTSAVKGGVIQTISWTIPAVSDLRDFSLSYSINDGSTWSDIVTGLSAGTRTYAWTVPAALNSTSSLVRVTAYDDYGNQSSGNSVNFTIDSTSPVVNAGEISSTINSATSSIGVSASDNFDDESDLTFLWTEISKPSGATLTISDPTATSTLFSGDLSGDYQVLLSATDRSENVGTSTLSFSWLSPNDPIITYPILGTSLSGNSTSTVTWTIVDPGDLSHMIAEYSIDNGSNWIVIDDAIASSSLSLDWPIIADTNSTSSLVRILAVDTLSNIATGTSPLFTIDSTAPTVSAGSFSANVNSATAPGATASDNFSTVNEMSYSWSQQVAPVGGSISFGGGSNILNPTLAGNVNGNYTALLSVSDAAGNASSSSVSFTRNVTTTGGGGGGGGGGSVVPCTSVVYGEWSSCFNGIETRSIISTTPSSCSPTVEQQALQSRTCGSGTLNYCSDVVYGEWGACINGRQTRLIVNQYPNDCVYTSQQQQAQEQSCGGGDPFDSDALDVMEKARQDFTGEDPALVKRLLGQILIQVEDLGRAWYVNPNDGRKYYLGSPDNAFSVMSIIGRGIKNDLLKKLPIGLLDPKLSNDKDSDGDGLTDRLEEGIGTDLNKQDTDGDGYSDYEEVMAGYDPLDPTPRKSIIDQKLLSANLGQIFIQVETNGEAWYVEPRSKKRYYLGRPLEAFNIMRQFGVGITNEDLNKIPVGQFTEAQMNRITEMLEARKKLLETQK